MKHRFCLLTVLACLCTASVHAQLLPALQPEQDACNAISVCGGRFSTPYSYHGAGKLIEQSEYGGSDACFSETNSVWLKLIVAKAGTVAFTIVPYNSDNDYDFAVFDITTTICTDLNAINRIRCNSADINSCYNGVTGLSDNTSGTITGPGSGADFISSINAPTGAVYLVLINNFSFGQRVAGFAIDFSASTATFAQPKPAALAYAEADSLVPSRVIVHLTGKVQCSSIALNGSDFIISPDVTILSAAGSDCRVGGYSSEIVLNLAQPLSPGKYTLNAQKGTDGNTLVEFCNGALALPDDVTFTAGPVPTFVSPPPAPVPPPRIEEVLQPSFTIPAGPWRNMSYTAAVTATLIPQTTYEMPKLADAKVADAPASASIVVPPPIPAQPKPTPPPAQPETTIPVGGWRPIENDGVVSTEKTSAKAYAVTLVLDVPDTVEPAVTAPQENYIPQPIKKSPVLPQPVAKKNDIPEQPKPITTAPPVINSTPPKQPINVSPSDIILRAGRWRKMSFTGAILSPKYSMARHRRVRIPELDAMLQKKPAVPATTVAATLVPVPSPMHSPIPRAPEQPAIRAPEQPANVNIVIPDNFSPNGDGINDSFKLGDIKFLRIVEFAVYDKNGTELYSSANNSAAWDGLYKGKKQEAAVYQYTIRLAWPDGRIETHKGNIELLQ